MADGKNIYSLEIRENDLCLNLVDPKTSKAARMALAVHVPEVLNVHRPLTPQEQHDSGYTMLRNKPVRIKSKVGRKNIEIGFCRYLSPLELSREPGLWAKLCKMQYILADRGFIKYLEDSHPFLNQHLQQRGTCFDLGFSVEPGHQNGGVQLGRAAEKGAETLRVLNILMAEVHQTCMKLSDLQVDHSKHWAASASITGGHHENRDFTSAQVNYSKQGECINDNLKSKADVHVDINDDPTRFTVLLFLNNLDRDNYEGLMNITSAKISCSGERFGALVFSGRHPHALVGYGKYEDGFDINTTDKSNRPADDLYPILPPHFFKGRISLPMYCRMDNIAARLREVCKNIWGHQAMVVFGTQRNHQEWKLRFYVKENVEEIKRQGTTSENLCQAFSWQNDGGEEEYPDLAIAQLCLEWAGRRINEHEELHNAALWAACGRKIPELGENGEIVIKLKSRKRKTMFEDGEEVEEEYYKVQCDFVKEEPRGERCKVYFWPENSGSSRCSRHVGK